MPLLELPTEVLLRILQYLTDYEHKRLLKSQPINRQFTALLRVFLFRRFVFLPHMVAINKNWQIVPWPKSTGSEPGQRELQHQRLEFWASDAMGPNLRQCVVSPRTYFVPASGGLLQPSSLAVADNPPDLLLRTFFDHVAAGAFTNLTHLKMHMIQLSKARLEILASVPTHLDVDVMYCPIDDFDDMTPATDGPRFSGARLFVGAYTSSPSPFPPWLSMWEPGALRQLTICAFIELRWDIEEASGSDTWLEDLGQLKRFPHLAELELVVYRGEANRDKALSYETTNNIVSTNLDDTQLDDAHIPSLEKLRLPAALLPLFWRERSTFGLKSLVVDNSNRITFLDAVRRAPAPSWASALTHLDFTFRCNRFDEDDSDARDQEADDVFAPSNLGEIFRAFPALESLKLLVRSTISCTTINDTVSPRSILPNSI
ncbi:F-box domain-containing protein [Mycena chlorophos]|uniref:F-box domain-containing protein n=1 Tax=Mycena chlorophos TaxID=658473 RepID=A0A8H6S7H2_MYCCL|nr:F-box domain-containing protein [Mycena chlorophos]